MNPGSLVLHGQHEGPGFFVLCMSLAGLAAFI